MAKHKKDTLPRFQQDEEGPPATSGLLHLTPAIRSQDAVTIRPATTLKDDILSK